MRYLLVLALLAGCCPVVCPKPPNPPALDTFCATAQEGALCCLGEQEGKCHEKECKP